MDPTSAAAALADIIAGRGATPNEASTRVEIVDRVLAEVLGWPRSQFNPEAYAGVSTEDGRKKWLDYHLGGASRSRLMVEAKKFGATFSLSHVRKPREVGLRTLRENHGPETRCGYPAGRKLLQEDRHA